MATMFYVSLLFLLSAFICRSAQQNPTRRQIISELLKDYDPKIVPDFDDDIPTNVSIQITVHDMYSVKESSMDYTVDIYLRQIWRDKRLDFSNISNFEKLELDSKTMGYVWLPDTFFTNEKSAYVHSVTTSNKLLHIFRNGTLVYSMRVSLTLGCTMLLHFYPFDVQSCPVILQSFGYSKENINLNWHSPLPFTIAVENMAQFELNPDVELNDFTVGYSYTGEFSTLKVELELRRKFGHYFLHIFLPSILLVMLSWVSFWVDPKAVPARVSLGVTCVLTMTTQSSGIRQTLPPVSYVKAVDIWMFVCLLFVFAALLEFAYVNVMLRAPKGNEQNTAADPEASTRKAKFADKLSRFAFPGSFFLFVAIFALVCGVSRNPSHD